MISISLRCDMYASRPVKNQVSVIPGSRRYLTAKYLKALPSKGSMAVVSMSFPALYVFGWSSFPFFIQIRWPVDETPMNGHRHPTMYINDGERWCFVSSAGGVLTMFM